MAYSTILASCSKERVAAFRSNQQESLRASRIISVSHILAYWIQLEPLHEILAEVIDGGEPLHRHFKHQFRDDMFHPAHQVPELHLRLKTSHEKALQEHQVPEDDWYRVQIEQMIELLAWASTNGEGVISLLGAPYNEATYARTRKYPKLT